MTAPFLPPARGQSSRTLVSDGLHVAIEVDSSQLEDRYGPRFDRTATVTSIKIHGREYLDPRGLADEFGITGVGVLGYADAGINGEFVKIGVGRVRRLSSAPYSFITHYPVSARFANVVKWRSDSAEVEQRSEPVAGYAYCYRKSISLEAPAAVIVRYVLENTGQRPFEFEQYNHNFFHFEQQPSDPAYTVTTDFALPGDPPAGWRRDSQTLHLAGPAPERGGQSWSTPVSATVANNRVTVSHRNGQYVVCSGDFPAARFAVWSIRSAISPEIFAHASLSPGAAYQWTRRYEFGVGPVPTK